MNKNQFQTKIDSLKKRDLDYPLLIKWGFPRKFINWDWKDFNRIKKPFYEMMYEYIINFPNQNQNGLYLYTENPGVGKTVIATVLVKTLIELKKINRKALFLPYGEFVDRSREGSIGFSDFYDELSSIDMVIFDDIGKDISTVWSTSRLYTIINSRYNSERPIIITSNFNINRLSVEMLVGNSELVASIDSRIRDLCQIINLDEYVVSADGRLISPK